MRKLLITLALATSLTPAAAALAAAPADLAGMPTDNRIKLLTYDDSDVYVIRAKYGYQTNIVFAPQEEIQTISVGDRALWQIIPTGNRLFIRPMDENLTTNMTLITNKHTYEFDLKSVSKGAENYIYEARFTYPPKNPPAPPAPEPTAQTAPVTPVTVVTPPPVNTQPNYNYTYAGADALAPTQVFDDGKKTYIRYRSAPKAAPKIFIVGDGGSLAPAAATLTRNEIVVDGVAGELLLKNPGGTVKIFNELLNPR